MNDTRETRNRLSPRDYDPGLFVNREKELGVIARRVNLARAGGLSDAIVNFWGIRGTGKSWLLQHVQRMYQFQATAPGRIGKQTFSLLHPFSGATGAGSLAEMTVRLAGDLLTQLEGALPDEERALLSVARNRRDTTLLVRALHGLLVQYVPVILLDNTELLDSETWQQIEGQFVEPLIITNRVLFIVSGREYITSWHRFETRRRVKRHHDTMLTPFDKQTALAQLRQGGYQFQVDLDTFYAYTAGSPLLLDKFAQKLEGWPPASAGGSISRSPLDQYQQQFLDLLRLSENDILDRAVDWLPVLNVLSPLRFYRPEALRFMMQELESEEYPEIYYLEILRKLERHADVVWWDRERRAYVTSPIARRVMNRRHCLDASRRDRYVAQHRRALTMYRQWIGRYPATSEEYICELWFHLASIYLAQQDSKQLAEGIQATFPLLEALRTDSHHALRRQFEDDRELQDLLPPPSTELLGRRLAGRG